MSRLWSLNTEHQIPRDVLFIFSTSRNLSEIDHHTWSVLFTCACECHDMYLSDNWRSKTGERENGENKQRNADTKWIIHSPRRAHKSLEHLVRGSCLYLLFLCSWHEPVIAHFHTVFFSFFLCSALCMVTSHSNGVFFSVGCRESHSAVETRNRENF